MNTASRASLGTCHELVRRVRSQKCSLSAWCAEISYRSVASMPGAPRALTEVFPQCLVCREHLQKCCLSAWCAESACRSVPSVPGVSRALTEVFPQCLVCREHLQKCSLSAWCAESAYKSVPSVPGVPRALREVSLSARSKDGVAHIAVKSQPHMHT